MAAVRRCGVQRRHHGRRPQRDDALRRHDDLAAGAHLLDGLRRRRCRYTHFFAFLSLFTASMLFFVLSDNILQMIVGWELVGVCSFALIGHWWEEKPSSDAALKAFITNRVGDVGLSSA